MQHVAAAMKWIKNMEYGLLKDGLQGLRLVGGQLSARDAQVVPKKYNDEMAEELRKKLEFVSASNFESLRNEWQGDKPSLRALERDPELFNRLGIEAASRKTLSAAASDAGLKFDKGGRKSRRSPDMPSTGWIILHRKKLKHSPRKRRRRGYSDECWAYGRPLTKWIMDSKVRCKTCK